MSGPYDEETKEIMRWYAGNDFDQHREVEETVFEVWSDETWTAPKFMEMISSALAKIPEDRLEVAQVDLELGDYESSGRFTIKYLRAETDEEVATRVERCLAYANERKAKEREQFERLKAKYEPSP